VVKPEQHGDVASLIRLISSLPPGTRSQEEIDAEIAEGRDDEEDLAEVLGRDTDLERNPASGLTLEQLDERFEPRRIIVGEIDNDRR
jgi:hypothetical protein